MVCRFHEPTQNQSSVTPLHFDSFGKLTGQPPNGPGDRGSARQALHCQRFPLIGSSVCLFPQGSDGARRSPLLDSDEPLEYFYDDVRTLYEGFQRGIHVSSKHMRNFCG